MLEQPGSAPFPVSIVTPKIFKSKQKKCNFPVSSKFTLSTFDDRTMKTESNQSNTRQKPRMKHYLATEMGLDTVSPKRIRHKKSHLSFDGLSDVLESCDYENRTVNSVADVTETVETELVAPKKRLMKRKPGYVDSEVDLMRTKESRPPINISMLLQKTKLPAIQECMLEDPGNKIKKKKSPKSVTAPPQASPIIPALTQVSSSKVKRISPNMSKQASGCSAAGSNSAVKYPILENQELINKFLQVEFTNNQKGRMRQVIKEILRGTSSTLLPDVINNRIQTILKTSQNLTDTDLRKIRILYNMLKKATEELKQKDVAAVGSLNRSLNLDDAVVKKKVEKNKEGLKRYVVFLGNLPLDVTREQILNHFIDIRSYIKDVRIPQLADDKKSCIAYVELDNAPVYEMALSKNHSMMGNRRINVLYTAPNKKNKISKTEAKAKSAKLLAMARSGQLVGSIPLTKKRSTRRAKARAAQRAQEKKLENKA